MTQWMSHFSAAHRDTTAHTAAASITFRRRPSFGVHEPLLTNRYLWGAQSVANWGATLRSSATTSGATISPPRSVRWV